MKILIRYFILCGIVVFVFLSAFWLMQLINVSQMYILCTILNEVDLLDFELQFYVNSNIVKYDRMYEILSELLSLERRLYLFHYHMFFHSIDFDIDITNCDVKIKRMLSLLHSRGYY